MLRKVATSLGISYSTLTSDLTQVNFSSIRAGTIEEREIWTASSSGLRRTSIRTSTRSG
jgi:capsid protein